MRGQAGEKTGWLLRAASGLICSGIIPLGAAPLPRPYTVENYEVSIQADLAKQRLNGEVKIRFHSQTDTAISALELDAGGLQIASVLEGQASLWFERKGSTLVVVLTNPLRPDEHRTITVRYQAGPAPGLKFFPDQIYTSVTTDWMACNESSGERATLHLTIAAPQDAKVAASGQLTATRASEGQSITDWQLDSATGPAWFGFALGRFSENTSEADGVKVRVLGAGAEVMEPTTAAMRFLGERSGKHYPGQTYTQVFAHGDETRAMAAGLTLLPESSAQGLGKQADALWLLTSQMAHQWYGLGIASQDWSDLWLSEGVSAYLADAFVGQRLGKESYGKEIEHSRQIYNLLRSQGKDRPLSSTEWTTRQDAGGEILAHKGVCFLELVHDLVGDSAFWVALRLYTSEHWGQAATSPDFQQAFAAIGGDNPHTGEKKGADKGKNSTKTLANLFSVWVYGVPTETAKKKKK
ncbi:MAG: M1 family aminopeptidase [Bryobacteraceae bacterium]|jgi:aminopeptidase N